MKRITTVNDMPNGEHWAVIEDSNVYHEGDERSRTHPGHGYPAYTENVIKYTSFENKIGLLDWISKNTGKSFKVIKAIPQKVSIDIKALVEATR